MQKHKQQLTLINVNRTNNEKQGKIEENLKCFEMRNSEVNFVPWFGRPMLVQPKHSLSLYTSSSHTVYEWMTVWCGFFFLNHSQYLFTFIIFIIFSPTAITNWLCERKRALAKWSLLRRVLFYCSFKIIARRICGREKQKDNNQK